MARRPDLEIFAEKHGIKLGTVADLIEYRNSNETTIERVAECKLPTEFGEFDLITYKDTIDNQIHYALRNGTVTADDATLVRVHLQNTMNDVLHSDRALNVSWSRRDAMARIGKDGGVMVILGNEETPEEIIEKINQFAQEDKGETLPRAKWQGTSRKVGVGSQILADLGVTKMKLLSSDKRYHSLSGFGLEVVEYISQ